VREIPDLPDQRKLKLGKAEKELDFYCPVTEGIGTEDASYL
jgi:hypothetical protein